MPNEVLTPDLEKEILSIRCQIKRAEFDVEKIRKQRGVMLVTVKMPETSNIRILPVEELKPKDNRAALAVVGLGLLVFWGAIIWGLVR